MKPGFDWKPADEQALMVPALKEAAAMVEQLPAVLRWPMANAEAESHLLESQRGPNF